MRIHFFVLSAIPLFLGSCSEPEIREIANPFPTAIEVRLFVEVGYDDVGPILSNADGVELTPSQREQLEKSLSVAPMPDDMAACFVPHHFFRYFDASGEQIGEVEVCFCCSGVSAKGSRMLETADSEILSADYNALKNLVEDLGERTEVMC